MRDPKSPGKARGKLAVPLPTPHMPGLGATGQRALSHLLPFCFSQHLGWRGNFLEAASRWEANLCSQGMARSRILGTGSVSTSPQTSKKREREKAKGVQGRGRQPKIAPCLLPSLPPRSCRPEAATPKHKAVEQRSPFPRGLYRRRES